MLYKFRRSQSIIEYATIMGLVIAAVVFGGPYLVNSIRAHFQVTADNARDAFTEHPVQAGAIIPPAITCDCQPEALRPFDPLVVDPPLDRNPDGSMKIELRQAPGDPPWIPISGAAGCGTAANGHLCQRKYNRQCKHLPPSCDPVPEAENAWVADPTCGVISPGESGDLVIYPKDVTGFQRDAAAYRPGDSPTDNPYCSNYSGREKLSAGHPYCNDLPNGSAWSSVWQQALSDKFNDPAFFPSTVTRLCNCHDPAGSTKGTVKCLAGEMSYKATCMNIVTNAMLWKQTVSPMASDEQICVEDPEALPFCGPDPGAMLNAVKCPDPSPADFFTTLIDRKIYEVEHDWVGNGIASTIDKVAASLGHKTGAYQLKYRTVPHGDCGKDACAYECNAGEVPSADGMSCGSACVVPTCKGKIIRHSAKPISDGSGGWVHTNDGPVCPTLDPSRPCTSDGVCTLYDGWTCVGDGTTECYLWAYLYPPYTSLTYQWQMITAANLDFPEQVPTTYPWRYGCTTMIDDCNITDVRVDASKPSGYDCAQFNPINQCTRAFKGTCDLSQVPLTACMGDIFDTCGTHCAYGSKCPADDGCKHHHIPHGRPYYCTTAGCCYSNCVCPPDSPYAGQCCAVPASGCTSYDECY